MGSVMSTTTYESAQGLQLDAKDIGPLPLLNRFVERLQLQELLQKYVPVRDKRVKLEPAMGLLLLLRNIMISRTPLYLLVEWAQRFDTRLLGLPANVAKALTDDQVGRALDALFRADRASLMTQIVVRAVREFDLDLSELHNDSTTVAFTGKYPAANGQPEHGHPTHRITHGRSKDYRPDLKQLLFILTTTADGSVPIWAHVDHGNTSDDTTHIRTWETLCKLTGTPEFLYVADCKLCSAPNLSYIHQHGGRFVTVIPATWREHTQFHEWLRTNDAPWVEILRKPSARRKDDPPDVYRGYEHPQRTTQGFRVLWIWSSQKETLDRAAREHRIEAAQEALQTLSARVGQPRSRLKTLQQVTEAAEELLRERQVEAWIKIEVTVAEREYYVQAGRGRPGPKTPHLRRTEQHLSLHWQVNTDALLQEARTDGIFPLTSNDSDMSIKDVLLAYKHQPALEKRHQQFKSVLKIRPVMLQNHLRIEAFLFLYFLALLAEALIERETRQRMRKLNIKEIVLYPEERTSTAPTTQRMFQLFDGLRRYRLKDKSGRVIQRFYDELTEPQLAVLRLHNISPQQYLSAAEDEVG
jgi:transposase